MTETKPNKPSIRANNAFFYYADLPAAIRFYSDVMGFTQVSDYGYATTFQIAQSSFLTLVDGTKPGLQHTPDEAKPVTLALVSEQVEAWFDYLAAQGVTIKHPFNWKPDQPHDGFVAIDPEGYFLEIERFNPHLENAHILPLLQKLTPFGPASASNRPAALTITATVLWLYYQDIEAIQRFYESVLGLERVVQQNYSQVYSASSSGFLGPVIAGRGLHPFSQQKGMTVSLVTDELEAWFDHLRSSPDFRLRTEELRVSDRYRALVGYDPEGYFIEFDDFRQHEDNVALLRALKTE